MISRRATSDREEQLSEQAFRPHALAGDDRRMGRD